MKTDSELKNEALASLKGKWASAALYTLVYLLIIGSLSYIDNGGNLVNLIITAPLTYGVKLLFYDSLKYQKEPDFEKMFEGFHDFLRVWCTGLLIAVYTFLWSLLLVIPGIMKSYSYAMTYYIMMDDPEMKYDAAIEKSMQMMDGQKMRLFLLDFSFIGWVFLSVLTCGIGFFFLTPYIQTTHAAFYEDLKGSAVYAHYCDEQ